MGIGGTEKRTQIGSAAGIGVVIVEAAGNSVFVRDDMVDLDIEQVCRGCSRDSGVNHVVGEPAVGLGQEREDISSLPCWA